MGTNKATFEVDGVAMAQRVALAAVDWWHSSICQVTVRKMVQGRMARRRATGRDNNRAQEFKKRCGGCAVV